MRFLLEKRAHAGFAMERAIKDNNKKAKVRVLENYKNAIMTGQGDQLC